MIPLMARFINPWVAAASVIIIGLIAFKDEIWRALKGIGAVLKNLGIKGVEAWVNGWVKGINSILSGIERLIRELSSIKIRNPFGEDVVLYEGVKLNLGRLNEVDLGENRSAGDAWREATGNLSGRDFANAAKDAWNKFTGPFRETWDILRDFGSSSLDFVTKTVGDVVNWFKGYSDAISAGDWGRVGGDGNPRPGQHDRRGLPLHRGDRRQAGDLRARPCEQGGPSRARWAAWATSSSSSTSRSRT